MNIHIVLWTLCMAVAGFLLVGSPPSITSATILGLITGAATGVALGIMFTHRARRKHT
jgi:GTPase involved in cell partitioning and DNA repair